MTEHQHSIPGIVIPRDVSGGEPCVVRTRISVWLLEQARRLGTSEADLLQIFPTLRAGDLVQAWEYVQTHKGEIDQQIHENEDAGVLARPQSTEYPVESCCELIALISGI